MNDLMWSMDTCKTKLFLYYLVLGSLGWLAHGIAGMEQCKISKSKSTQLPNQRVVFDDRNSHS